jgi:hypothetical protein
MNTRNTNMAAIESTEMLLAEIQFFLFMAYLIYLLQIWQNMTYNVKSCKCTFAAISRAHCWRICVRMIHENVLLCIYVANCLGHID